MANVPESEGTVYEGNERYEGYSADLAEMISHIVGFDYIIRPVKDGMYGSLNDDNSWNGMVGELVRQVSLSDR